MVSDDVTDDVMVLQDAIEERGESEESDWSAAASMKAQDWSTMTASG